MPRQQYNTTWSGHNLGMTSETALIQSSGWLAFPFFTILQYVYDNLLKASRPPQTIYLYLRLAPLNHAWMVSMEEFERHLRSEAHKLKRRTAKDCGRDDPSAYFCDGEDEQHSLESDIQ
nr:hypothetical transcript [Hymenolepis microstoma]